MRVYVSVLVYVCVGGCRAERGVEKERERMRASERKNTQDSERRQGRVCVWGGEMDHDVGVHREAGTLKMTP